MLYSLKIYRLEVNTLRMANEKISEKTLLIEKDAQFQICFSVRNMKNSNSCKNRCCSCYIIKTEMDQNINE